MRSTYRPHLALRGPALGSVSPRGHPSGAAEARVAHLDEDEATLALEAARPLLASAGLGAETLSRIVVAGPGGPGWAAILKLALGASKAEVQEVPTAAWESGHQKAPSAGDAILWVRAQAPRPHQPAFAELGPESFAVAHLTGAGIRQGPDLFPQSHRAARPIDAATYERIARLDRDAPASVPMGAYVPRRTWDATLEARLRLHASWCAHCHAGQHPPLARCPRCGRETRTQTLGETGRVYSHTVIGKGGAPTEFDPLQDVDGPYGVAVVEFPNGVRTTGMLTETSLESLAVGTPVEPAVRRLYAQDGAWRHGIKYRATGESG